MRFQAPRALAYACALMAVHATSAAAQQQATGTFHVLWGDPISAAEEPRLAYTLSTDDGRTLVLDVAPALLEQNGGATALHGRRVTITGAPQPAPQRADVAPATFGVTGIRRDSAMPLPTGPSINPADVTGAKPYVTLLCAFPDFPDIGKEPPSFWERESGMAQHGAGHYWLEASDGQLDMTGSRVVDWVTLPKPMAEYVFTSYTDLNGIARDCAAAADSMVHFPDYAGVILQMNTSIGCCAWGGGGGLDLDGGSRAYGMVWIGGDWHMGTYAHEIGHSFGLPHSSGPYGMTYDSRFDVMSAATWYNPPGTVHLWGTHTLAHQKNLLGWIPPARHFVAPRGRSTILLERSALPGDNDNYVMATIPIRGSQYQYYTIEARARVGYDSPLVGEGVVVVFHFTPSGDPRVVDVDMNGEVNDAGAIWTAGETWYDRDNDIRMAVEQRVGDAWRVTIDVGAWNEITVDPLVHVNEVPIGVDSIIRDSAFVNISGPDSMNVAWRAETFTPRMQMETRTGVGPGVVRWSTRTAGLPAGRLPGYVLVRADDPATHITINDTLVVLPRQEITAGFSRPQRADTMVTERLRNRSMNVWLSGEGADTASWTLSVSSPRLVLDTVVAGVGTRAVWYNRSSVGVAPGLYVDTMYLTLTGSGQRFGYVDSSYVVSPPMLSIYRLPGTPHIQQEGAPVLDSVYVNMFGELSEGGQYLIFPEGPTIYITLGSVFGSGSGWVRFHRQARTLAPGMHTTTITAYAVLDDSVRVSIVDTVIVDAYTPRIVLSHASRRDSVAAGTASVDSVWVSPEGAGSTNARWVGGGHFDRTMPLNRSYQYYPGSGTGPGWFVYGRVTSNRPDGMYVDTITVRFENGLGAVATIVDTLVLTDVPDPPPPAIVIDSDTLLRAGVLGVAYADTLVAHGGAGALVWSNPGGVFPPGLSLAGTGVIAGTPTQTGAFYFSGVVTDTTGQVGVRWFRMTIGEPTSQPLVIVSDSVRPQATMGAAFADVLESEGGSGGVRWTLSDGALPAGVALDSISGALDGIVEESGTFAFRVSARVTSGERMGESVTHGFVIVAAEPQLTEAAVVGQLMDGSGLNADQRRYLDLLGNRNGRVDIGDVSVWMESH